MDFVEQLKSSVDIVKVVGEYVRLRKSGAGPRYVGLCPFHTEKTPSFSVHQTHQFYKCFGCGAGGDVIKFIMEIERLSFFEALKLLAERNGITLPRRSEYADEETRLRAALFEIHEQAARRFRENLRGARGAAARDYLAQRGVSADLAEEFGLGFAEAGGGDLVRALERAGFDAKQLEASGLVLSRPDGSLFDRFRNRLMFPIHSESGKIIAFAGRALAPGDEPKYLNSPETPIYRKNMVLYNLHRAKDAIRRADAGILVEGYMDVIGLWAGGVHNVVASCGTALTTSQVRALKRHSEKIVVNFDPDAAGSSAAERSIQMLLEEGMQIRVLQLEGGLDPDEFIRRHGADVYREKLSGAPGYFHWLADRARSRFDMHSARGRVATLQFLLPSIQRVNDRLERAAIATEIAAYLGVESGLVLEHFKRAATSRRDDMAPPQPVSVRPAEKILLNSLLLRPEIRGDILPLLRHLPQLERMQAARIFQTMLALHERSPDFRYAELEARLAEEDKKLLAGLVFADEMNEEDCTLEQALDCLKRLADEARAQRKAELRLKVKQAERAGDLQEAMRLAEELVALDRQPN